MRKKTEQARDKFFKRVRIRASERKSSERNKRAQAQTLSAKQSVHIPEREDGEERAHSRARRWRGREERADKVSAEKGALAQSKAERQAFSTSDERKRKRREN